MNEIDRNKGSLHTGAATRRSVLTKFVTTFSGGLSINTVSDSAKGSQEQASANLDPTNVPRGLRDGGNSSVYLEGSFLDFVPVEAKVNNVIQLLPGKAMHVSEVEELIENSNLPAVMGSDPVSVLDRHERTVVINVFSTDTEPGDDIKHWYRKNRELRKVASLT